MFKHKMNHNLQEFTHIGQVKCKSLLREKYTNSCKLWFKYLKAFFSSKKKERIKATLI